jgi:DNA-binding NtrC family response regulator
MRCDNALTLGHFDGTVILDGVERLDVAQQRTLLAWLDEHWRTQIVSLTCERLHDRVRTGGFRNELYYLLNVICVELWPSLEVGH